MITHVDSAQLLHADSRRQLAEKSVGRLSPFSRAYQGELARCYQFLIPPGKRVLELGCSRGDLLASLEPSYGVGMDFSSEAISAARERHPSLHFQEADVHHANFDEPFDFIILSDLINDLWDVQAVFEKIHAVSNPHTRVILNFHSRLWQPILALARKLKLARKGGKQNWFTYEDVANLLQLSGFEVVRRWEEILMPAPIPILKGFCNRFLVKNWPFRLGALANFVVARPLKKEVESTTVSVIVPARNEEGNIQEIMRRVPQMGAGTELIFVEGHSSDRTFDVIKEEIEKHPELNCKVFQQTGKGKGDAVRLGFNEASGDILMILDADLTVPPEDLPRFYDAIQQGKGEFINGVRLVYPMEDKAMRFFNLIGNKFFSLAFSWLLGQPIKDTLCGTKVLRKSSYESIAGGRDYFGKLDPFGDFDLLFGAAKQQLRIVDMPIRYRERTYGTTNIQRWKHGMLLLRMVVKAARRLKYV